MQLRVTLHVAIATFYILMYLFISLLTSIAEPKWAVFQWCKKQKVLKFFQGNTINHYIVHHCLRAPSKLGHVIYMKGEAKKEKRC